MSGCEDDDYVSGAGDGAIGGRVRGRDGCDGSGDAGGSGLSG